MVNVLWMGCPIKFAPIIWYFSLNVYLGFLHTDTEIMATSAWFHAIQRTEKNFQVFKIL